MYYDVVAQCTQTLKNLEGCLDKAEQYAAAKKFDMSVLMDGRLAPDMRNFIYQVQSACDYVKGAAGWLSGQAPPKHEDHEKTIADVRARIRKTIALAESIALLAFVAAFAGAPKWIYYLGAAITLVGFWTYAAPTRAAVARDQEALNAAGCSRSLVGALRGSSGTEPA